MIMKKIFLMPLFLTITVFCARGENFSLSAGAGGFIGGLFTRYSLNGSGNIDDPQTPGGTVPIAVTARQEANQFNVGGYLFFDATWTELSVGFQWGVNAYTDTSLVKSGETIVQDTLDKGTGDEGMLSIVLLGRYPFRLNSQFVIFPLAGLEYKIALFEYRKAEGFSQSSDRTNGVHESDSDGKPYELSTWNSIFIDIGGGVDYAFYPPLYLRTEVIYAFRLKTAYEKDKLEMMKNSLNVANPKLKGLTSGPTLRVALGYRL
jgi:hypothetical protein